MIPQAAIDLILNAEGVDQPAEWPGGDSGISLGVGYDLSAESGAELSHDWAAYLTAEEIARLQTAVGASGDDAAAVAHRFRDIHITRAAAQAVFAAATLPKYEAQTTGAFPGSDLLPDLVRGALVSLVFNRGTSMAGDRRREMRSIREAVAFWADPVNTNRAAQLPRLVTSIAAQLRSMKRLWQGQGLDGLLARREAEARLVESSLSTLTA